MLNRELGSNGKSTANVDAFGVILKQVGVDLIDADVDATPHDDSTLKAEDGAEEVITATDTAAATTASTTTTAGVPEVGLKQGGVSPDPTHSDKAAAVTRCSHPGTKSCGMCKATPYCSAKCQTADWPHHKEECPGQLLKVSKANLEKAIYFYARQNWMQALRHADISAIKLKQLKDRRLETVQAISDALVIKFDGYNGLGRQKEALECVEEQYTIWVMNHMRNPGTITASFRLIKSCINNEKYEDAENYARNTYFMITEMMDNFIPSNQRPEFLADGSNHLALAVYRLAKAGGIPPEGKQRAGEEAVPLARKALELHIQLKGTESADAAMAMGGLANILGYFNDVDDDEVLRLHEQAIAIYRLVEGSSSANVATREFTFAQAYHKRATRTREADDADRCTANLELSLPHFREAARIYRINNDMDKAALALRNFASVEEGIRKIKIALTTPTTTTG